MEIKGIPKTRIGPEPGGRRRSIRKRQAGDRGGSLNAAERSALWGGKVFLCAALMGRKKKIKTKRRW